MTVCETNPRRLVRRCAAALGAILLSVALSPAHRLDGQTSNSRPTLYQRLGGYDGVASYVGLAVSFRYGEDRFRFFSAVTVLGTPQDITLQELRIECFFPLDEASAAGARSLNGP